MFNFGLVFLFNVGEMFLTIDYVLMVLLACKIKVYCINKTDMTQRETPNIKNRVYSSQRNRSNIVFNDYPFKTMEITERNYHKSSKNIPQLDEPNNIGQQSVIGKMLSDNIEKSKSAELKQYQNRFFKFNSGSFPSPKSFLSQKLSLETLKGKNIQICFQRGRSLPSLMQTTQSLWTLS